MINSIAHIFLNFTLVNVHVHVHVQREFSTVNSIGKILKNIYTSEFTCTERRLYG
jgi:hypothetical protein